jgi:hypothetical protein
MASGPKRIIELGAIPAGFDPSLVTLAVDTAALAAADPPEDAQSLTLAGAISRGLVGSSVRVYPVTPIYASCPADGSATHLGAFAVATNKTVAFDLTLITFNATGGHYALIRVAFVARNVNGTVTVPAGLVYESPLYQAVDFSLAEYISGSNAGIQMVNAIGQSTLVIGIGGRAVELAN